MKIWLLTIHLVLITGVFTRINAQFGGLKKWFNTEVVPTIKGERPLNVDPTRVRVSHDGKDILRASSEGSGSVYVDFGVAKLQTSDLQKRISQAGAILSGNTAVMTQVAYEQFQKFNAQQLKAAQQENQINISKTPPDRPINQEPLTGKEVIIFNHTLSPIQYALNGNFFTLESQSGFSHTSSSGEFFLQLDEDTSGNTKIGRYYLSGKVYGLYLFQGMDTIGIQKHN
jgi:hypothetical protein